MTELINRLDIIERERLAQLKRFDEEFGNDKQYDEDGGLSVSKNQIKRFVALCDYKLRNNIKGFRKNLRDAAELIKSLFDRYDKGEPIAPSFVTMNSFSYLLDALAAGDFALAGDFAKVIGGREAIEKENDHPFDFAFGYALKALLLNHQADLDRWLPLANSDVKRPDVKYFQGYVDGLYAIRDRDAVAFEAAMKKLLQDHRKLCRLGALFDDTEDEVLCFWGLGLINLARHQGLDVTIEDQYLPRELII